MTPLALADLHARCFSTPAPWSAESFASQLDSRHCFLITDPAGRGFVLGRAIAQETEVLTLATDPSARRQGIARHLMQCFDAEARSRGADTAFLEVAENNAAARALYAVCGFRQVGRRPDYYVGERGPKIAAMILCKSLA